MSEDENDGANVRAPENRSIAQELRMTMLRARQLRDNLETSDVESVLVDTIARLFESRNTGNAIVTTRQDVRCGALE